MSETTVNITSNNNNNNNNFISMALFKALYSHVNNIIDKYLQIYNHILIIFTMSKKKEKIKTKATIKLFYS